MVRRGREGLAFDFVNTASLILVFKKEEGMATNLHYVTLLCLVSLCYRQGGGRKGLHLASI